MRHRTSRFVIALVMPLTGCAPARVPEPAVAVAGPRAERVALERVVALLPRDLRYPIVVIDPEGVPDSQAVRRLDAFTVREPDGSMRPRIYLNRESFVVREVLKGSDFHAKVLAAIVVHEGSHVAGGSEVDARRAESRFFADLMARGIVSPEEGGRYLTLLRQRESVHDSDR